MSYCRYPPMGARGFSPARASRYFQDSKAYADSAADEIALIVQIETPQAVSNMDQILATKSINGVFIGPSDMASFMGLATQIKHPDVEREVDKAIETARARKMPFGLPTWTTEETQSYVARGGQILTVGGDMHYLGSAARASLARS